MILLVVLCYHIYIIIGSYYKSGDAKKRVMAAVVDGDWKVVATANGVPLHTAYGWIRKKDEPIKLRGGKRFNKVEVRHIDSMLEWLSQNLLLTLKQIRDKLIAEENLDVSTTIIHKHIDDKLYTLKKVVVEPFTMNSEINKLRRADYVESLMAAFGQGKRLTYIDQGWPTFVYVRTTFYLKNVSRPTCHMRIV